MATAPTRSGPNGTNTTTGSTPLHTRDLGSLRSGEPGSAFRGLVKGRGAERGGGRGRGRGGRAASRGSRGGGAQTNGTKPDSSVAKNDASTAEQPSPTAEPSNPAADKASAAGPNNERANRPKAGSRRPSRNVPTLVIEPTPPNPEASLASVPSRPPNRRRRSQQHAKSPASAGPAKQSLSAEPSQTLLSPQRAHTGPPSPITQFKDAPPHLSAPNTATFDMKHSIDALVERVRAVAMDSNRPITPGSHIDWAGDEDDSLPDLDDWGVTTNTSVVGDKTQNEMSPILVNGLKPLPEPLVRLEEGTKKNDAASSPVVLLSKVADKTPPSDEKGKSKRTAPTPRIPQQDSKIEVTSKPINYLSPTTKMAAHFPSAAETTAVQASLPSVPAVASSETSRLPLHPSLPAKPVAAVESLLAYSKPSSNSIPMRVSLPVKQTVAVEKPPAPVEPVVTTVEVAPALAEQSSIAVVKLPSSPPLAATVEALSQPMLVPPTTQSVPDADTSPEDISDKLGLSASIHAPFSSSTSPPIRLKPTGPPSFSPTHQRAHTVGRPPGHQSHTPHSFQSHLSRSGVATPRGSFGSGLHHGRTHSSPPVGSGLNPRIHSQRPVITGDAISRIARTIGGSTPTRAKEISTAKE